MKEKGQTKLMIYQQNLLLQRYDQINMPTTTAKDWQTETSMAMKDKINFKGSAT